MRCSIIITTKNRKDELAKALVSALNQNAYEVIVWDDGSTDGTADFVAQHFASVQLVRSDVSVGLINARNRLAQIATGDLLFSIDDDAVFSEVGIVSEIAAQFVDDRIAAIAIPLINVNQSQKVLQKAQSAGATEPIRQFIGTAHALRRDVFLKVGGYPDYLGRQEEELHLAAELYRHGYKIVKGHSDPIHHFESVSRSRPEEAYREARNLWLFALRYAPIWALLPHLAGSAVNVLRHRRGFRQHVLRGLWDALCYARNCPRTPFTSRQYVEFRKLSHTLDARYVH